MSSRTRALLDQVVSDLDQVLSDDALAGLTDAERVEVLQAASAAFRRVEAVVVETIFARPGLGRTLLAAVTVRDVPVVTGVVLVTALAYIVVTLATDLLTRVIDPRLARREAVA